MPAPLLATALERVRPLFPLIPYNLRMYLRARTGYNRYDPDAQFALRQLVRPGDVVLDVGANIGELTTVMSRLVGPAGRVYAFEANPACLPRLRRVLRLSRVRNAVVVHAAVGEQDERPIRLYSDDRPNTSFKMSSRSPDWLEETRPGRVFEVRSLTLDRFCERRGLRLALAKIDVEGFEREVLIGFHRQLEQTRPHLLLEHRVRALGERDTPLHYVEALGYRIALPGPWRWLTADEFTAADRFETCIVAVHSDRAAEAAWII